MHELYNHQVSQLHRSDARVKILFTMVSIAGINIIPFNAWSAYILFFSLIISLGIISRVGLPLLLKRSLMVIPILIAALPVIFVPNGATDSILNLPGTQFGIYPYGVMRFINLAIRAWISVQFAVLFSATTQFNEMLAGFRSLHLPKMLVAVFGLMWRYLFVMVDEAGKLIRARTSRSPHSTGRTHLGGSILWRARVTGGMAGSLFLRSLERSERVYAAMVARGYNGEVPLIESPKLKSKDMEFFMAGSVLVVLIIVIGFLTGG